MNPFTQSPEERTAWDRWTAENLPDRALFGFKEAIVCALFSGNKYREYLVEADEFQQQVDRDQVVKFLDALSAGVAPDWDGSASTYESVRAMNPELTDDSVELGDLAERLIYAHAEFGECEKALNALKSEVLDAMGFAKKGLFDGDVVVTRQAGRNGASPFLVIKKGKN
jgi:hypothetical protein